MKETQTYEDLVERLKESIISQAKSYLEQFGEFFPFGAVIDKNNNRSPLGVYLGDEHPPSTEVIQNLEEAFKAGIQEGEYIAIAMGGDVRTVPPGMKEKIDAIEIRVDVEDSGNINYYLPYEKLESGEYKYYDIFTNMGTLSLWE